MIVPDLCDRTYMVEILRTRGNADAVTEAITALTTEHRPAEEASGPDGVKIQILHSFLPSTRPYHRATRRVEGTGRTTITVPRRRKFRGKPNYFYDVLLVQCRRDVMVAVPYYALAEEFFVRVDRALAGKRVVYEKIDITNLVMRLGQTGAVEVQSGESSHELQIGVTRCQLAYSDPQGRTRDLQRVYMSGSRIGNTDVYRYLVEPVLNPSGSPLMVTPTLLGFALFMDGIKKTSAVTDRHGNFQLWVGPGVRRIERLFSLLDSVESIKGILSTTSNVPILQSRAMRTAEGENA